MGRAGSRESHIGGLLLDYRRSIQGNERVSLVQVSWFAFLLVRCESRRSTMRSRALRNLSRSDWLGVLIDHQVNTVEGIGGEGRGNHGAALSGRRRLLPV